MTAAGWLSLAGLFMVTTLPPASVARLETLVDHGRLGAPKRRRARAVPWSRVLLAAVVTGGLAAIGAVLARAGPVLAAALAVVLGVALRLAVDLSRRRTTERLRADVLIAVRLLVGELRAGSPPAAALDAAAVAAPLVGAQFHAAAGEARRGLPAGPTLAASTHDSVRAVGLAWEVGATTGSALAEVLSRVGADLDARTAARRATSVALAGPRSSAAVLAGLPALGIALGVAMGAEPLRSLTGTPVGQVVCCLGVVLDSAGVLWIRRILHGAEAAG